MITQTENFTLAELRKYLEGEVNTPFRKFHGLDPIRLHTLTRTQRDNLLSRVEKDLSPENLIQDGEADECYILRRRTFLLAVKEQLEGVGFVS